MMVFVRVPSTRQLCTVAPLPPLPSRFPIIIESSDSSESQALWRARVSTTDAVDDDDELDDEDLLFFFSRALMGTSDGTEALSMRSIELSERMRSCSLRSSCCTRLRAYNSAYRMNERTKQMEYVRIGERERESTRGRRAQLLCTSQGSCAWRRANTSTQYDATLLMAGLSRTS